MLYANSRYANPLRVRNIVVGNEVHRTVLRTPPWRPAPEAEVYVWKNTDRIFLLAQRYYGDPTYWWKLADLNPQVLDFNTLQAGDRIWVPRVQ